MTRRKIHPCEGSGQPRICARRLIRIETARKNQGMSRAQFSDQIYQRTGRRYTPRKISYAERIIPGSHLGDNYTYLTDAADVLHLPVSYLITLPVHVYPTVCPYCTLFGPTQYCMICGKSRR